MRNNHVASANRRRQVALRNLEKHLPDKHGSDQSNWADDSHITRHLKERDILRDRIGTNAQFRKLLKARRKPAV